MENLLPKDGFVYYDSAFFSEKDSSIFMEDLINNIKWRQDRIKIFGKETLQPRLTAWYGDSEAKLRYSGITMNPEPWTKSLSRIKSAVEKAAAEQFNGVLLNLYRDGTDSMGWHRDNEKELGPFPTIASVSFGETRSFCLKHIKDKSLKLSLELTHGSLLIMAGSCQENWLHSVPKRLKVTQPRLNLTFRKIIC